MDVDIENWKVHKVEKLKSNKCLVDRIWRNEFMNI